MTVPSATASRTSAKVTQACLVVRERPKLVTMSSANFESKWRRVGSVCSSPSPAHLENSFLDGNKLSFAYGSSHGSLLSAAPYDWGVVDADDVACF